MIPPVFFGSNILSIAEDEKGRIWFAGYGDCLELYLPEEDRSIRFDRDIPGRTIISELILTVVPDNDENIWLGTLGNGLERIKIDENYKIVESERFFTGSKNTPAFTINDILIDSKNQVWVGTSGEGLICLNQKTNTQTKFSRSTGLPSDLICSIKEDSEGIIWGSTNAGIFSMNPETNEIHTYLEEEESFSNEYFTGSGFKNAEGTIYFGGISGIAQIVPGQFTSKPNEPEVYITGINISNKPYRQAASEQSKNIFNDQNIAFWPCQNDLSFDFSVINFAGSKQYQIRYKLENYDDEWHVAEPSKNVFYPNLSPGDYKFKIKAFDPAGQWNKNEAVLNFTINLPWYKKTGAFLFYAVLLGFILFRIRKNILSRYQLKNQLKLEQLELEKMQELNEIKEQFFTNISHEFRTPLTLIMSPVKTLLEKENKPEKKELLNIMLENAAYLQGLTNQILDISRMEAGQEKLRASAGSLTCFLQKNTEKFSQLAKERMIDYQINIPRKRLILFFEKEKIGKVLVNLISNAFKYSPDGGKITINLIEAPNSISISVSNEGEGISEEEKAIVFERFYKGNNNSISTGIGLALSKQLVEMHHGKISLQSENRDGGQTIFTVELPKGTAHLLPEQIMNPMSLTDESAAFSTSENRTNGIIGQNRLEKDDRPVVLVVEDNDQMRKFVQLILQEQYVVLEAKDGKEGLEKAVEFMPEIIISDVMMPKMNGFELSSKLKNNLLTSHIFIILLTAKVTQENIQEGFSTGADSYLTKPFEPNLLKLKIQNLLQSRKRFRETILLNPKSETPPDKQTIFSKVDEEFMAKTIAEIEKRISDPDFKVEELAKAVGFSKSQFYRKLKGLVGKSSNEFIRTIRLKRAAELLNKTDFRIAEITYNVGFNDLEYFRSCFKKEYGLSPTKYRKRSLEKGEKEKV